MLPKEACKYGASKEVKDCSKPVTLSSSGLVAEPKVAATFAEFFHGLAASHAGKGFLQRTGNSKSSARWCPLDS